MKKIQIGIPCGKNSEKYTRFLMDSINKTKSGENEIEFIVGMNQAGADLNLLNTLIEPIDKVKVVTSENQHSGAISEGHGKCADMIMKNMTSKHGMIVDADVAFLMKDWDIKLLPQITDKNIIIGTEYGRDDNHYWKNANVIVCLFDVNKLKETGFSWKGELEHITIDENTTNIYNRNIGEKVFLDVGSTLPKTLIDNGYTSEYLELLSPRISGSKHKLKFLLEEMRGDEYQLNGAPIFTHLGRSTSRCFDRNPDAQLWKKKILEWLSK